MVVSMEYNTFHASKTCNTKSHHKWQSNCWILLFSFSEPLAGSMIRPEKVSHFETVRDAIENRYILTPIEDDMNFNDFQMVIRAPLMEFVGVEKTWKKQR